MAKKKPEIIMLVDGSEEPHSYFAYGWWSQPEFKHAMESYEIETYGDIEMDSLPMLDQMPVQGWGRWYYPPTDEYSACEKVLLTGCWPIPFLNFKYTQAFFD